MENLIRLSIAVCLSADRYGLSAKSRAALLSASLAVGPGAAAGIAAGTLGALLYSTVVATGDIGAIDIILLALSFIVWFLQVIIQIATVVIESQLGILKLALEMDVEAMIRPVTAVGDAIKKIAGKDTSAQPKPPAQEKLRKKIAELGAAYKKEKQEKRKITIFFKKKDKAQGVSEKSGQTSEDISSEKEKIANK